MKTISTKLALSALAVAMLATPAQGVNSNSLKLHIKNLT